MGPTKSYFPFFPVGNEGALKNYPHLIIFFTLEFDTFGICYVPPLFSTSLLDKIYVQIHCNPRGFWQMSTENVAKIIEHFHLTSHRYFLVGEGP